MMRYIFYIKLLFSICLFAILGCNKELDIDLPDYEEKIVVDGWIEQGKFPVVILTINTAYFSSLDSISMRELIVTKAKVTVSDGVNTEILTLKKNDKYFPSFIYEGVDFRGWSGNSYYLTVKYYDYYLTAVTTIPEPVAFDSLWCEKVQGQDSDYLLKGRFTDSPEEGDYYRLFTKRIGIDDDYVPTLISTFPDSYFNGESFSFTIYRGFDNLLERDNNTYFSLSDTVSVKLCAIDEAHYKFWDSFGDEIFNAGNPFAASGSTIVSNIEGGLGVWGGYGASTQTIIVQP